MRKKNKYRFTMAQYYGRTIKWKISQVIIISMVQYSCTDTSISKNNLAVDQSDSVSFVDTIGSNGISFIDSTNLDDYNNEREKGHSEEIEYSPHFNYLSDCNVDVWVGRIYKDGRLLVLGSCFQKDFSYDLILVPKDTTISNPQDLMNTYRNQETISSFYCYSFLIKKVKAKKPENEFDKFDYVLPSSVVALKLEQGKWREIKKERVSSIDSLRNFKTNIISNY